MRCRTFEFKRLPCARVGAASPRCPDPQVAKSELDEDDLSALDELFEKMNDGFQRGDAETLKRLLAESDERDAITRTLKQEFKEARYLDFRVEKVIPDNSIPPNRHSVDVTIRLKLLYLDDPHSPESRKPVENTTFQNFIVQRYDDGSFKIVNSTLFDNMGRRKTGMGVYIRAAEIINMLGSSRYWRAVGAGRLRRVGDAAWKSVVWRWVAVIPLLGNCCCLFSIGCGRENGRSHGPAVR